MVSRLKLTPHCIDKISNILHNERSKGLTKDGHRVCEFETQPLNPESVFLPKGNTLVEIPPQYRFRHVFTEDKTAEHISKACMALFSLVGTPNYLDRLDGALALRLKCSFERVGVAEEVVQRACQLLERLPSCAPVMMDDPQIYQDILPSHLIDPKADSTWGNLKASRFLDRNTIRMALHIATCDKDSFPPTRQFLQHVNNIASLLEGAVTLSSQEKDNDKRQRWFMIKAFLWTSWHCSALIHLSVELEFRFRMGFISREAADLDFECIPTIAKLSPGGEVPGHICRWAYEMVKTDRASVGLDLRLLGERLMEYANQVGVLEARCCISESGCLKQCDGSSPHACDRFRRMKVEDQSAHAGSCDRNLCTRLYWRESSYRSVRGARAVSIHHDGSDGELLYCLASPKTMAVSHVWCHGQGGRPERQGTGLNSCLHRRYCDIAQVYGFESYWMDTPCIPEDPVLKMEAIREINNIFRYSGMTLVCDRDMMQLDIRDITIEGMETLLAVLLLCDWNVRAWTFLESMRGRHNLHLLCKDDRTISLRSVIQSVHLEGSLEIAALFVTARQLLPLEIDETRQNRSKNRHGSRPSGWESIRSEEAACLLSRRYTTKPGDELIIWSLLCGETVYNSAESFWQSRRHVKLIVDGATRPKGTVMGGVRTGFLVSSAPRIQHTKNFSWAPSRPDLSYEMTASGHKAFHAYDGQNTPMAYYDDNGLEAEWLIHEFPGPGYTPKTRLALLLPLLCDPGVLAISSLERLCLSNLGGFRWGAILQAINDAAAPLRSVDKVPFFNVGNPNGNAVVLVGSQDRVNWKWLGVYGMDEESMKTLSFDRKEINIV